VSSWLFGAVAGGTACLVTSPFSARLAATAEPARRPLAATALVGALLGVLAGHAAGWSAALPAFVALALLATPLLLVDARDHRLPDRLVLPAAGAALALLTLAAAVRGEWVALGRSSLGFGDVKLAGLLALYLGWLSWGHVFYGIFAGFVLGALVAVVMLASRRVSLKSHIALGPALITGALLIAAVH
jgi:leader peptidase (prepilin peptidase) / N-methyltransferase